jgi:hypothetical protein
MTKTCPTVPFQAHVSVPLTIGCPHRVKLQYKDGAEFHFAGTYCIFMKKSMFREYVSSARYSISLFTNTSQLDISSFFLDISQCWNI